MRKLYENFHIFHFQNRIVSAEYICGNTVCWFLSKNISNFVPAAWKLDNPYYHIDCSFLCVFFQKFLPCFQEFLIYWQIFFQFFYLNNNKSKQIQNHSRLLKRRQNIKLPFQISSGCFQFCPRHCFRHLALL